ncbi:MAG: hypothetical protein AAF682_00315 [Planctomycetota bacterium]
MKVLNSIVRGNSPDQIAGAPTVEYSNVEGGFAGTGNIDADPLFVSGSDFHLTVGSPGVDAGDNTDILQQVLTSSPDTISVATGGTIDFFVDSDSLAIDADGNNRFEDEVNTTDTGPGPGRPSDMGAYELDAVPLPSIKYWVVGSISGTSPGFLLSGVQVPLNPDPYFLITIVDAGAGGFDTIGDLDIFGEATASITLPPGLAAAGFTVHHAAGIFDLIAGPQGVSNPVSTDLVP